jgi:arginine decarboxylase
LIETYGTPFKLTYLPRIGEQIKKARTHFNRAIKKHGYSGTYQYCYCTKTCHFRHVMEAVLRERVHLETSSSFDIDLIEKLTAEGKFPRDRYVIHNGHKSLDYLRRILDLHAAGFENSVLVLDSQDELDRLLSLDFDGPLKVGLRMATNEAPQSDYYTSRFGIAERDMGAFCKKALMGNGRIEPVMLHVFVDTGIRDNLYYWGEFQRAVKLYIELRKIAPGIQAFNIGGGFPIRNNLGFEYDYEHMINEMVRIIKEMCTAAGVDMPDLYSEFGRYTVGESGAIILSVVERKQQNDTETWYIINNSLMNTIPDAWSILEKFILLPINKWNHESDRVNIGGISCDRSDYYNSEDLNQEVVLPRIGGDEEEPLYIGFFHTGAYQDSISGYGGIKHCLIPSPKHIIIDRDNTGNYVHHIYRNEQTVDDMLSILGF